MPDTRTRRGPHPKDRACFAAEHLPTLRSAVIDLSWLQTRGYSDKAALKLVGDRYSLRDRQRKALQRTAASDDACARRRQRQTAAEDLEGSALVIDGYNVLLSVEAALSGGLLLLGRDGALRDLAAMSRHYRRVSVTRQAISLIADTIESVGCRDTTWFLDRPVSNSARLKQLIEQTIEEPPGRWIVQLTDRTDQQLLQSGRIIATADSGILDHCSAWFNLARQVVATHVPDAWIIDLEPLESV